MRLDWDSEPPPIIRHLRRLRACNERLQQTGAYLMERAAWTWALTITFAIPMNRQGAHRAFRDFTRMLAGELDDHVPAAWGLEHAGDRHHIHALIGLPLNLPLTPDQLRSHMRRASRFTGVVDIDPFDSTLGWAWYLAKGDHWDTNIGCPRKPACRRKRGCLVARVPWPKTC